MGTLDNPSADKFNPPGQERFEPPQPKRVRAWYAIPITVLYFIAKSQIGARHTGGRAALGFGLAALGLGIANYFITKRAHDDGPADGAPHSTHQNITR
jgi:hypothetical protein